MAQKNKKKNNNQKKHQNAAPRESVAEAPAADAAPPWVFWLGFIALLAAIVPSIMLVGKHLNVMELPGCQVGAGCDMAQKSAWAKIPGLNWPVSHLGLAYFLAMAMAWILFAGERMTSLFKAAALFGGVVSAMYVVVIVINAEQYLCWYCISAHVANFVFLSAVILAPIASKESAGGAGMRAIVTMAATWLVATGVLYGIETTKAKQVDEQAQKDADESVKRILEGSDRVDAFVGRYVRGANPAKVRLVMFTGYQCPDCQRIEKEVIQILEARNDVAVSIKQFPLNSECNGNMGSAMHKNACWAARAAETAGLLRGAEGFWELHDILFEMKGEFNAQSLPPVLERLGYEPQPFIDRMMTQETLDLVMADTVEGGNLGVMQTPTIYINGVEFKGTAVIGALTNAVNELASQIEAPGDASNDVPLTGEQKMISDWEEASVPILYPRDDAVHYGVPHNEAELRITVWGDYSSVHVKNMDDICRARAEQQPGVSYTFLHFPLNLDCNTRIGKTRYEFSCIAAKASMAARAMGGEATMRAMHEKLLERHETMSPETILDIAEEVGLSRASFQAEMQKPEYDEVVTSDVLDAATRNVRGIPMLIVNEKRLINYALDRQPRPDVVFDHIMGPVDGK